MLRSDVLDEAIARERRICMSGDINANTRYSFADVRTVMTGISQLPRRDRANEMSF